MGGNGRRVRLWGAAAVLVATGIAMTWAYLGTHQIYPDTQFYLAWTYRLMGYDEATAERMVLDYIRDEAAFAPYPTIFGARILLLSTRPRILLPLLSVPFVKLFGPGGIVVVPAIAFVLAMFLMYRFATIHASVRASAAACVLAVTSALVVNWSVGGLTDSLALALHAAVFLLLPWRKPATWRTVLGVAVVCALAATARATAPYTVAAMAGLWLWAMLRGEKAMRRSWTAVTAGAAGGVVTGLAWTKIASAPLTTISLYTATSRGEIRRYADIIPWYGENLPARLADEFGNILRSPTLVLLLALSLVACVTARRTIVPWLVVPAWIGALGILLINLAATSFRYELEVLPATIVAVAVLADQALRVTGLAPATTGKDPDRGAEAGGGRQVTGGGGQQVPAEPAPAPAVPSGMD
jgi:hypothetical protein